MFFCDTLELWIFSFFFGIVQEVVFVENNAVGFVKISILEVFLQALEYS